MSAACTARPVAADGGGGTGLSGGVEAGARVARLYEDAAAAAQRYEEGRLEAEAQRVAVRRLERLLSRERTRIAVLHEDLGRLARAHYRQGGGLPYTARMLLSGDPEGLLRGHRAARRAEHVVDNAVDRSHRAETRLAADEARARARRESLDRRTAELAEVRRSVETKLEEARWLLQEQADASAAAGACRGAVPLDRPGSGSVRAWVAPVSAYELSAGFGSGGRRWAHRHTGQDFAVPIGTPVRAVGAGRVVRVSCGGPFGIEIVLRHTGGYYTQYAHLAAVNVEQGQRVAAGQWIGQSGTTGNSTGPHLHFEVRITAESGSGIDPVPWLLRHGVEL
ncbi:peptidase [Streptomyces ruber]|uniref:Peptidase n=3 Tax=Streptomyces TaxID=1883 RepID=A0A918BJP7_9ACTN|nr:peptidase [Streptomyces ruber]